MLDTPAAQMDRPAYPPRLRLPQPLAFAATRPLLAVGGADGVYLYDVPTLQPRHRLAMNQPVISVAFSPEGTIIAAGLDNGQVVLWSLRDQTVTRTISTEGSLIALVFTPDGHLAVASTVFGVALYRVTDGQRIRELGMGQGGIGAIALTADGQALIVVDRGRSDPHFVPAISAEFRRLGDGAVLQRLSAPPMGALALSGSARAVAFTREGVVWLWPLALDEYPRPFAQDKEQDPLRALGFAADGSVLAGGTETGQLLLWRVADSAVLQVCSTTPAIVGERAVVAIALSPDKGWVAAVSQDGQVRLWPIAP